jgi:hypothetical protein
VLQAQGQCKKMNGSVTILKQPLLNESQDYELLRSRGLEYIQQLGSRLWTDYNIHDPGITLLELLSYAITDLGNRCSYDMKDLLAAPFSKSKDPLQDPRRQAFFTAREILTINPWTNKDFRKMLIDIDGVKNAWLQCKQCPCDNLYLYANCKTSELQYEWTDHPVVIKGFYDVLTEFEDDEGSGNLNSGKISSNFNFSPGGTSVTDAAIEMRLPSWQSLTNNKEFYKEFLRPGSAVKKVEVKFISGNKEDNADILSAKFNDGLRRPLYATLKVTFFPDKELPATSLINFNDVPLRVWFRSDSDRKALKLEKLNEAITDASPGGIMAKYLEKIHKAEEVIAKAKKRLHECRNLCEDYCSVKAVETEDFAVCADMEAEPFADIEQLLAEAYYRIDQYMRPDLKFYSLQQLLDKGKKTDEIFEGPVLKNGFIEEDELDDTELRTTLYTSDIINLIMDIPGVKAVKNLTIARYDADGNIAENQPWSINVSSGRKAALYTEASKVLVYKNGLPFLPDKFELKDTLQVIKGKNSQPKFSLSENDLPVPEGTYYTLNEYYPLQYSLPLTYGVGYDGLPSNVTDERKAQAKQLKGYLLFYEQLLVNYLEQLANVKELFALDPLVDKTNYSKWLTNTDIKGIEDLYNGLNAATLQAMMEDESIMLDRRNRFLDHMLSRFAEQFTDYAMMLYSHISNGTIAGDRLIKNKIDFLKDYPFLSANRGRSFNYKNPDAVCSTENISGLQKKIQRLLGFRQLLNYYELYDITDADGKLIERRWRIIDSFGNKYLNAPAGYVEATTLATINKAEQDILELQQYINLDAAYEVLNLSGNWAVHVKNTDGDVIAEGYKEFSTQADADAFAAVIKKYAAEIKDAEKIYVVEHILLRSRNIFRYFQLYEEKDKDGKFFERRWRLIDQSGKIYLSGSTRYPHDKLAESEEKAKREIGQVIKYITMPGRYQVAKGKQWYLNLLDETGEVIATRKQHFATKAAAEKARDEIIKFAEKIYKERDTLLGICIPNDCSMCGEEDPYSFRLTLVLNGEIGLVNTDIVFRRFAEKTIREEVPAHLGVKICWVSAEQFKSFEEKYCIWLQELAKQDPDPGALHDKLEILLAEFKSLKNVYPKATLHDCVDGNDENRVLLGQTVIISDKDIKC